MSKLASFMFQPQRAWRKIWRKFGHPSLQTKLRYDLFDRPHYAYCMASAARLARALKKEEISVLEFGVAGGRGLLEIEALSGEIEQAYNVKIQIWGFDTGEGLPAPVDYRDLPYIWQAGFYRMDRNKLEEKLRRARLVLGDVKDTVPRFVEEHNPAPIGAVFFDLDFWSSTRDALGVFSGGEETMLPRVFCYCDDVISVDGGGVLSEDVGQLRAVADYNEMQTQRKLRRIAGLDVSRPIRAAWPSQIYVHHHFGHSEYNTYIHDDRDRQLKI